MNEKKPYTFSTELASGETVANGEHESISNAEEEIRLAIDAALDMDTAATPQSLDSLLKNMEKIKTIPLEEAQRFMDRFDTNIMPQLREDKLLQEGMRSRGRLEQFASEVNRRRKIVDEERARIKAYEEKIQQARQDANKAYKNIENVQMSTTSVAPGSEVKSISKEKRGLFSRISKFFGGT